jgi:hypothetical protein
MRELNDYISMHPVKEVKHRLSKEHEISIESVNHSEKSI